MAIDKETFKKLIEENSGKIIFKFTATWCAPCKKSAPFVNEKIKLLPEEIKYYEIDIDESLDVYGMLKTKRVLSGVPSLICYYEENKSIWPDEAISSSSEEQISYFFDTILSE